MEHRYSPRVSTSVQVLIYKHDMPVAIGVLRNIGRHGLFVETDYGSVAIDQPLDIELLVRGDIGKRARCRAMVVYKAAYGFGLAIDDACAASCDRLAVLFDKYRRRECSFGERAEPVRRAVAAC